MTRRSRSNGITGAYRRRPYHYGFSILAGLTAAVLYWFLYQTTILNPYVVWLIALSITTCAMFWVDKMLAKVGSSRIPEVVLHIFTLAGGFPGQWFGRFSARHKINSQKHPLFRIILIVSILVHGGLIYYWF